MSNREDSSDTVQSGIEIQTIAFPQEPPPPYSPTDIDDSTVINQSVIHQTVIFHQTLKNVPIYVRCPSCHKITLTTVQFENSQKTHLLAGFICGLTLWCLICCLSALPYMTNTFKTADHFCSNCNYFIGSYSKF